MRISGTGEDWNYFIARWSEYKDATGIKDRELVLQLLECCEELRKDLTRTTEGSLAGKTEVAVLAAIEQLAVREENILLAHPAKRPDPRHLRSRHSIGHPPGQEPGHVPRAGLPIRGGKRSVETYWQRAWPAQQQLSSFEETDGTSLLLLLLLL